jgi:hypothetical protein
MICQRCCYGLTSDPNIRLLDSYKSLCASHENSSGLAVNDMYATGLKLNPYFSSSQSLVRRSTLDRDRERVGTVTSEV